MGSNPFFFTVILNNMAIIILNDFTKPFGYATIGIYGTVFLTIVFLFHNKRPWCHTHIGYTACVAALASMIYSIFGAITIDFPYDSAPLFTMFFSISNACLFLPGLIGFHRISLQRKSEFGEFFAYLGYAWATIEVGAGSTLTVIMNKNSGNGFFLPYELERLAMSLFFLTWGFVFFLLRFICMHVDRMQKNASRTMILYVFCFVVQTIAYTVISNMPFIDMVSQVLMLLFFTLPRVVCIFIAAFYGHRWTLEYSEYDENNYCEESLMEDGESR
ncbi:hypothetical protein EDC94DRAFT_603206 [Helicostylum pulchrum]|nr:hypothetical protein EDC94DRAFT_603206 [Helicostylum pulchrum]